MLISFPQALPKIIFGEQSNKLDARYFQIAVLISLCITGVTFKGIDIGAWQVVFSLLGAVITQYLASKCIGITFDWRSAIITAFSLSLLLRMNEPYWAFFAAALAIASKFLVRISNRHIFNPANFAIVILLIFEAPVWVSPGQWGASIYWVFALAVLGALVLSQTRQLDIAVSFIISYAVLIFGRAAYLGDGWQIPWHQMQSGALLVFAFFMISDPKTIPKTAPRRALFACCVAVLAYSLQFHFYIREAIFYALFMVCIGFAVIQRIKAAPLLKEGI